MAKTAVFTMKLERELRDEFAKQANLANRYASDVVRELMREYIRRREDEAHYQAYVRRRILSARAMATDGETLPDDEVAKLYMFEEPPEEQTMEINDDYYEDEPLGDGEHRVRRLESDYLLDPRSRR